MITNPQLFLFWLAFSAIGFWILPPSRPLLRRNWLAANSMILVFAMAPYAACICLAMSLVTWGWTRLWLRVTNVPLLWCGILSLAAPLMALRIFPVEYSALVALGVTFLTFKSIGTMIDAYLTRTPASLGDVLLLNFFFPIYSSGPIENLRTMGHSKLCTCWADATVAEGLVRICLGLFKSALVCGTVLAPLITSTWPEIRTDPSLYTASAAWAYVFVNFAYIYINFSGYTDIAIGAGRVFGLRLTENFNSPFLATNIMKFWQRWHISLGDWVLKYLYFPMIRVSGHIVIPIVITFFLVGLWHASTPNYLIWGLCHGLGLGFVQALNRKRKLMPRFQAMSRTTPYSIASWAITMTFVSWLSSFANASSLEAGWYLIITLLGGSA